MRPTESPDPLDETSLLIQAADTGIRRAVRSLHDVHGEVPIVSQLRENGDQLLRAIDHLCAARREMDRLRDTD